MSQGSSVASGLVRVTIASGSRRVDLVLPGSIPVAELVPELARSVGLAPDRLCRACVTGHYPTPAGQRLYEIDARESRHADGAGGIRTYER